MEDFNYYQKKALLDYIKTKIAEKGVAEITGEMTRSYLFSAFIKLQMAVDEHNNILAYTE